MPSSPSAKHAREGDGGITESSRLSSQPLRWAWKTPRASGVEKTPATVDVGLWAVNLERLIVPSPPCRLGDYRPVSAASVPRPHPRQESYDIFAGTRPIEAAGLFERITAALVSP
ncbi:hypothetical protein B5X24_HaOG201639 [Helicoverpa armigera]|nr:hypothetical protein B5X24_HaOG201639 [Helicoverpa armigera]